MLKLRNKTEVVCSEIGIWGDSLWINKLEKFSEVERERERERKREGGFTIGLLTGKTLPQAQLRGNRKMIPATKCPQVCVCVCVCVSGGACLCGDIHTYSCPHDRDTVLQNWGKKGRDIALNCAAWLPTKYPPRRWSMCVEV